jgi:site-specific DNA-methyltransferase (adenine-specific)
MRAIRNRLLVGDARDHLPKLPAMSVDCVITSPPYFRLRNYGEGGQIGLEASVGGWVDELHAVLGGIARVLKPTGSVWLNLGDTYSHHERDGAGPKSLLLGPERLALAMIQDGWVIRNKVVWAKTNPMPTSVRDRLSCTYEIFYLAARSQHYYFDLDAIREPHRSRLRGRSATAARRAATGRRPKWAGPLAGSNVGLHAMKARGLVGHPLGKNPGDVWTHATSTDRGVHHAMFPINLIRRPLLASCPERVCAMCGKPWERSRTQAIGHLAVIGELEARCSCRARTQPGLVLDPFMGAGTVAIAAEANRRDWLGIELNPAFARLAERRITRARTPRACDDIEPAAVAS